MSKPNFIEVVPGFKGAIIRDPQRPGWRLPEVGGRVPDTPYFRRRLAAGDIKLKETPAASSDKEEVEIIVSLAEADDSEEREEE